MYKSINEYQFTEEFKRIRPNQFSYEGLKSLFNYLEEYEESTGESIELDVIGLCCDFSEYETLEEFQNEYGKEEYPTFNEIEYATEIIYVDSESFIIRQF